MNKYNLEVVDQIQELLKDNNQSQVSQILKIPTSTVRYFVKKHNLTVNKQQRRLNINDTFFDCIDSSELLCLKRTRTKLDFKYRAK